MRARLPELITSQDIEVNMSNSKRAPIRQSSNVMGGGGVERSGERHHDRGKSSLACQLGSEINESKNRVSVRAISNQGKLPGAITGSQNRAFFGRSGCRILQVGYAWRTVTLARLAESA
jgi:hypothetical protein